MTTIQWGGGKKKTGKGAGLVTFPLEGKSSSCLERGGGRGPELLQWVEESTYFTEPTGKEAGTVSNPRLLSWREKGKGGVAWAPRGGGRPDHSLHFVCKKKRRGGVKGVLRGRGEEDGYLGVER